VLQDGEGGLGKVHHGRDLKRVQQPQAQQVEVSGGGSHAGRGLEGHTNTAQHLLFQFKRNTKGKNERDGSARYNPSDEKSRYRNSEDGEDP
jgi:hypothetical protein